MIKKFLNKILSLKYFLSLRKIIGQVLIEIYRSREIILVSYKNRDKKLLELIEKTKKETELLLKDNEAYQLCSCVLATNKLKGDIAEVGVFRGGSAKLICETKGNKNLYLFDTFEGLPEPDKIDGEIHHKGEFTFNLESVKYYLKKYPKCIFIKGLFPTTANWIKDKSFSFVHLDVDLYDGTRDCLDFFYPRMEKAGIILIHDYLTAPGAKIAVDEFFKNKIEPVIELSSSYCLIVKL